MQNYFIGLLTGIVMGGSTVLYITSITESVPYKKRMKIIMWVGIPAGMIMGLLAQFIGRSL